MHGSGIYHLSLGIWALLRSSKLLGSPHPVRKRHIYASSGRKSEKFCGMMMI